MADKEHKKSRKRHYCAPDLPSKRRLVEIPQEPPRRVMLYTPSSELLKYLGLFLQKKCYKLKHLSSTQPINWLRRIDNFLLTHYDQRESFVSSGSVAFIYMLCRELISPEVSSMEELRASLHTCFYIAYCYIGHELSYPLMPFLVESSKTAFWERCLSYINRMSPKMMRINTDRQFYSAMLAELKAAGREDDQI